MKPTDLKLVVPGEAVIRKIVNTRYPITQGEMEEFVDGVAAFIEHDLYRMIVGCEKFWSFDTKVHEPTHRFTNGHRDRITCTYDFSPIDNIGTNIFFVDTNNGVKRAESLVNLLQQYATQKGFQRVELRPCALRLV